MLNINKYIIEKLHLNKDTDSFDPEEYNEKNVKDALNDIDLFLIKQHLNKDDFEIKLNNKGEVCIYIYGGGKDYYKELEDDFYTRGFAKKEWFAELFVTNYGLRIRINKAISREDFNKVTFRHR